VEQTNNKRKPVTNVRLNSKSTVEQTNNKRKPVTNVRLNSKSTVAYGANI